MKNNQEIKVPAPLIIFDGKSSLKRRPISRLLVISSSVAAMLVVCAICFVGINGKMSGQKSVLVASSFVKPLEGAVGKPSERTQIALMESKENIDTPHNSQTTQKQKPTANIARKNIIVPHQQVELVRVTDKRAEIAKVDIEEIFDSEVIYLEEFTDNNVKMVAIKSNELKEIQSEKNIENQQEHINENIKDEIKDLFRNPNIAGLIESVKNRPKGRRELASVKLDFANSNVVELFKRRDRKNVN